MREPTEAELTVGLAACGLKATDKETDSATDNARAMLGSAWALIDANLAGREVSIVKTKIEEAALWLGRTVER